MSAYLLNVKKLVAVGFLVFMGLWIAGVLLTLGHDYSPPAPMPLAAISGSESRIPFNAQFANNLGSFGMGGAPLPMVLIDPAVDKILVDEKRAFLTSTTTSFKDDEAKIRAAVDEQKGRYFHDQKSGLEPSRHWTIEIGVSPEKFDALVEKLQAIGKIASYKVDRKDRTSEFHTLKTKWQSLKTYLESITKLRGAKNPSLEDALRLEGKIHDIEKEMEGMSVQFGDLIGKESYYHVHVTLTEHQPGDRRDRTYSLPQRIGYGFVWATAWWFGTALALVLLAATVVSVRVLREKSVA